MKIKILIFSCLVSLVSLSRVKASETTQDISNKIVLNANYTNLLKEFALGEMTNGICVGILKKPQPNFYVCLLYVGQTNSSQLWIAPPKFQRGEYYLYDSSGKVIPYLEKYHPANTIYNFISKVPKNVHNVYEGLMGPPFAMPYDQIALTNVFQIEQGGDYKLVVKCRIMKIQDDGSLSVMEFPPVSLPIHLRDEDVKIWRQNK
jgi:hypothetical protein